MHYEIHKDFDAPRIRDDPRHPKHLKWPADLWVWLLEEKCTRWENVVCYTIFIDDICKDMNTIYGRKQLVLTVILSWLMTWNIHWDLDIVRFFMSNYIDLGGRGGRPHQGQLCKIFRPKYQTESRFRSNVSGLRGHRGQRSLRSYHMDHMKV